MQAIGATVRLSSSGIGRNSTTVAVNAPMSITKKPMWIQGISIAIRPMMKQIIKNEALPAIDFPWKNLIRPYFFPTSAATASPNVRNNREMIAMLLGKNIMQNRLAIRKFVVPRRKPGSSLRIPFECSFITLYEPGAILLKISRTVIIPEKYRRKHKGKSLVGEK